jgi:hypothetical protein
LGAVVLRYFTDYITGVNGISWFSTGLFILATGIRPWKHMVDRITERTRDLHDAIHYPPRLHSDNVQTRMEEMMARISQLEKSLANARSKITKSTEDLYEYVDDGLDGIEKTVRRHERKCEKCDVRLRMAEENIEGLRKTALRIHTNIGPHRSPSYIPSWLHFGFTSDVKSPSRLSPPTSKHTHRTASLASPVRLESIPEESPGPPLLPPSAYYRIPGVSLALRCGDLVTLPWRTAMRYLLSLS